MLPKNLQFSRLRLIIYFFEINCASLYNKINPVCWIYHIQIFYFPIKNSIFQVTLMPRTAKTSIDARKLGQILWCKVKPLPSSFFLLHRWMLRQRNLIKAIHVLCNHLCEKSCIRRRIYFSKFSLLFLTYCDHFLYTLHMWG